MSMIPRFFQPGSWVVGDVITLTTEAAHHLGRVRRAALHDVVIIFNGASGEYEGMISHLDKKKINVHIRKYIDRSVESPLELWLAQSMSRNEKMDYVIQKSVELGVKKIIPLLTERSKIKLDQEKREKRASHWQSIVIGACEQSGRNRIPDILPPKKLMDWLPSTTADACFILSPHSEFTLSQLKIKNPQRIILLVGPEGGFSEKEMEAAASNHFLPLNLGPRILRTETAAVAAITALQCVFGDMG